MKVFSFLLFGFGLLISGLNPLFAASDCNRFASSAPCLRQQKSFSPSKEDKDRMRVLRRQRTREAYYRNDPGHHAGRNDEKARFHQGKKMTADERLRLRQQIDEAGQVLYHE